MRHAWFAHIGANRASLRALWSPRPRPLDFLRLEGGASRLVLHVSAPTAPRVGSLLIPRLTTLGLSEGGRRCVTLGSSYIGANRASASGLVVSPSQALGLCEVSRRCDKLGSYSIGANRASASGLVVSSSQALGLSEVRRRCDKLGSLVSAPTAPRPGRCGLLFPRPFITCGSLFGPARWYGGLVLQAGLVVPWFKAAWLYRLGLSFLGWLLP